MRVWVSAYMRMKMDLQHMAPTLGTLTLGRAAPSLKDAEFLSFCSLGVFDVEGKWGLSDGEGKRWWEEGTLGTLCFPPGGPFMGLSKSKWHHPM